MTTPRWHQPLLPGELRENPDGRRSARDWIVDVLMYVIALGVGAGVLADSWDEHGETMVFVDIGLGIACLVAIWWRRSHPALVGVLTTAAGIVSGLAAGSALIAGFNVALRGSFRAILAVLGVTACSIFIFPLVYASGEPYLLDLFIGALITAVVLGWGLFARARREQVLSLHERAAQLEAEQRLRIDQARDAERRRIAREMHDVLAHRVSLLSLHAGALEFRPDAPPEEIAEAAGVIRASARTALEELREVIGVLRDGSRGRCARAAAADARGDPGARRGESRGGHAGRLQDRRGRRRGRDRGARAHGLPRRPGGADQRAQARARRGGRRDDQRRRAARRRGRQPRPGRRRRRRQSRCRARAAG